MSCCLKFSLPESHGKRANDLVSSGSCEGVEEDFVANANGSKVLGELLPQQSMVLMCVSCNCSFTGSFCSNEVSHKLILLGRVTI